ncbi:MAG TPA: dienelactone hydrolase family protein [Nocardioidaceae bacterium]|nr:dienelactone hydrolase family protein [Nocardioidaceae bacterium]
MCFDFDSRPPVSSEPGDGVTTARVALTSSDGTRFSGFYVAPAADDPGTNGSVDESGDGATGVVVLPDVRGIYPFYEGVAVDLANHGYHAVVIDYYGRTAGDGPRGDDFDPATHVMQTTTAGVQADIRAAAAHLRDAGAERIACIGFCFGGRHAFWAAAPEFGFAGVVGFYGVPGTGGPLGPGPTQHAARLEAPILGIFGGADDYIPRSEVDAFDAALAEHGVDHETRIYPGAPHSFFDIKHAEHASASLDAWRHTHLFLSRVTATAARTA